MPNKKALFVALLVLASLISFYSVQQKNRIQEQVLNQAAVKRPAFMNAQWGMSPDEIVSANRTALEPATGNRRFFQAEPGDEVRYQTLQAAGHKFLGREAVVYYTFLDGRLHACHVFVSDGSEDLLDADMRRYLIRQWGSQFSEIHDESPLKLIWQFKDLSVNYWIYRDEMSLVHSWKAGVGVSYKPDLVGTS